MKQSGPEFHIDFHDFVLEVHVIGYRTEGESIVILLKEGSRTFYSILIDDFCKRKGRRWINRSIEILKSNDVAALQMIIMTHPHEDHIRGMDNIINLFCDNNTMFFSPAHSFDIERQTVQLTDKEKSILKQVRNINDTNRFFSNEVGVSLGGYSSLRTIYLYDNDDPDKQFPIIVEINALSPIASINDHKISGKVLSPNDLSISTIICICDYYLLFASDATNDHIDCLDSETLSAVKFVKIPHHASDTSNHLLRFFSKDQLDYACSTSYHIGNSHLPNRAILNQYSIVSRRVDYLGCKSDHKQKGPFGELCYSFRMGPTSMLSNVQSLGLVNCR